MNTPHRTFVRSPRKGSSLVTTLLVITVLTIIVVAFMQSMAIERRTAQSYANVEQARMAAESAGAYAANQLADLFQRYPDSATAWFQETSGPITNAFTAFFYRRQSSQDIGTLPGETNQAIFVQPLFSGSRATNQANATLANLVVGALESTNFYNFNRTGSVGMSPANNQLPPTLGAWVEILQDPAQPRDLTIGANGKPVNPPVARFAFWMEDETFKVNVNLAGTSARGAATVGTNASEISLSQWTTVFANTTNTALATNLAQLRGLFPQGLFTEDQIRHAVAFPSTTNDYAKTSFTSTIHSSTLNLSRGGAKRVNINELVFPSLNPGEIRTQLDRIIATIKNPSAMPLFGQRFARAGTSAAQLNATNYVANTTTSGFAASFADIYLEKLAANIRDYLDEDSQPTVVKNQNGRPVEIGNKPLVAPGFNSVGNNPSPNDVLAIGKEAVPALSESAIRVTLFSINPPNNNNDGAGANYSFALDYYFELWNPTHRDITLADLGPNPFLRVYNQFAWDTGGGTVIPPGRPFEVSLSSFVDQNGQSFRIPAGRKVVLTTDPQPSTNLVLSGVLVFRPSPAAVAAIAPFRTYSGLTRRTTTESDAVWSPKVVYRVNPTLGSNGGRSGTTQSDYDTHMVIGNANGILEGFTALPVPFNLSINNDTGTRLGPNNENFFFRGGSLRGNSGTSSGSATGDPTSLNEQLQIVRYTGAIDDNGQTRFFSSGLNNSANPASSSFGAFNRNPSDNGRFIRPDVWSDFTTETQASTTGSRVIANQALVTVGELGHVYDPARIPGAEGLSYARGGGLTLRIGQSDRADAYAHPGTPASAANQAKQRLGRWDGGQTSASRNWTAWRLTDVFSTTSDLELPGRLNLNSVSRDNGYTLATAFAGFQFAPVAATTNAALAGAPGIGGVNLVNNLANANSGVGALIQSMRNRLGTNLVNANIFWERGELSEIDLFNTNTTTLAGVSTATTLDRGREELVRRSIELLCAKGNVFTVYCAGQALQVNAKGQMVPKATHVKKIILRLVPVYNDPLPADATFNPVADGATASTGRFRKPDRYDVVVLSQMDL